MIKFNVASRMFPQYSEGLLQVYFQRPDLMKRFNLYDQMSVASLQSWLENFGYEEYRIPPENRYYAKSQENRRLNSDLAIFGFTSSFSGVSEALVRLTRMLDGRGVSIDLVPMNLRNDENFFQTRPPLLYVPKVSIFAMTPTEFMSCANLLTKELFYESRVILYFAWEIRKIPDEWREIILNCKEIWTVSNFSKASIKALHKKIDIKVIPIPIAENVKVSSDTLTTEEFTNFLPHKYMLFQADYFSCLERKNILGVMQAFNGSIACREGFKLFLHVRNLPKNCTWRTEIMRMFNRRYMILFEESISSFENLNLIKNAFCYISLHRSEGFGISILDSMSNGVPVIVSRYSGNLDFCNEENSLLISGIEKKIGPKAKSIYYNTNSLWFEPDIDLARNAINKLIEDLDFRDQISNNGKKFAREKFTTLELGRLTKSFL